MAYYLVGWSARAELWGPFGVLPRRIYWSFANNFPGYSFLGIPMSERTFSVCYAAGAIAVALWLIYPTRVVSFAVIIAGLGLLNRNPLMLSGGDNLIQIALFTIPLLDFRASPVSARYPGATDHWTPFSVAHNLALRFLLIQLCLTYVGAALYKLSGDSWLSGDALATILDVREFDTGFPRLGLTSGVGSAVAGYITIALELLFPLAVLDRRWRLPIVGGLIVMHVGIALMMGLVYFGITMSAFLFLTLDDVTLTAVSRRMRRVKHQVGVETA